MLILVPTIECPIFRAKLTEQGCLMNQRIARQAAQKLQRYTVEKLKGISCEIGQGITIASAVELERLAGCCQCEKMPDREFLQRVYTEALNRIPNAFACSILEENNYSHDPEVQHQKELRKFARYNRKRRERKLKESMLNPSKA